MMVGTEYVLGIDVSKRKLDTALMHNGKLKSKVFDNTLAGHRTMLSGLEAHGGKAECTHICLEATGPYSEPVALTVAAAGWKVSVLNPVWVQGFAQSERLRKQTVVADAASYGLPRLE